MPSRPPRKRWILAPPALIVGAAFAFAACQTSQRPSTSNRPAHTVKHAPPLGIFEIDEPLVALRTACPGVQIELPYSTRQNVAGTELYPPDMTAMLDRPTAAKLRRVHGELKKHGRGIKVWDAYRPPEVQWELWRRSGKSGYVADPRLWWSKHCSGRAVDVTLFDLESGAELPMPSKFDDFSEQAASDYKGDDPAVRENLKLLRDAMLRAGFVGIEMEWWHYANAEHYEKNIAPVPAAEAGVDLSHLGDIKRF